MSGSIKIKCSLGLYATNLTREGRKLRLGRFVHVRIRILGYLHFFHPYFSRFNWFIMQRLWQLFPFIFVVFN